MKVRTATVADALPIATIHVESWRAAYREQMPPEFLERLSVSDRAPLWEGWLRDPGLFIFVAETARSDIVGFTAFRPVPDSGPVPKVAELGATYVAPGHWRHGIGRALMNAALAKAHAESFDQMVLWVLTANRQARAFYESHGFLADDAHREEAVAPGVSVPEVRYRLKLPPPGS